MNFWRKQVIQPALDSDLQAAIAEQQAVLERDPNNPQAHFALGCLAHLQRDTERAVHFFLRAIELNPEYAAAHVSLGRIYAVQGRYQEAWYHAREASRLGETSLSEQLERYGHVTRAGSGVPTNDFPR